jgi:hypothetical protein
LVYLSTELSGNELVVEKSREMSRDLNGQKSREMSRDLKPFS